MIIGGFQSVSLSDYPGYTASVVYTRGCNFRCGYCHNHNLIDYDESVFNDPDRSAVLEMMQNRRNLIDGVVITGGEPTIQAGLKEFIVAVRKLGLKVKLDTNGSRPEVIGTLLKENLLDYIAMDIKAPINKYRIITGVEYCPDDILNSIALIASSGIAAQFRTTHVKQLLTDDDIMAIRNMIPSIFTLKVQNFIPQNAWDESLRVI